jgi:hypothetical protein
MEPVMSARTVCLLLLVAVCLPAAPASAQQVIPAGGGVIIIVVAPASHGLATQAVATPAVAPALNFVPMAAPPASRPMSGPADAPLRPSPGGADDLVRRIEELEKHLAVVTNVLAELARDRARSTDMLEQIARKVGVEVPPAGPRATPPGGGGG